MDIIPPLLLQVILITLNAIFASAEIAIISMNEAKVNKLIADGSKRAEVLLKFIKNPAKLLATIQIAITLSGFLGSAFAAENFADKIVKALQTCDIANKLNSNALHSVCVVVVTLILSYFTLVFGELVPKRFAMRKAQGLALSLASPLNIIAKLFTPAVWFLTASTNVVLRCIGIDPTQVSEAVEEEDILLMVDSSEKIQNAEKQMIQNVFEFNDITANEFATHRTELEVLWEDDSLDIWDTTIRKSFHKHYPVCKDTTDNIIGIFDIKSYFQGQYKDKSEALKHCLSKPYFVPETIKADLLFQRMKQTHNCFAVILDEYGGVNGVVTFDDILEQIVGNFNADIPQNTEENIIALENNKWRVQGITPIDEINQTFYTSFPKEEYETFGGLIFGYYGNIPEDNSNFTIDIDRLSIHVTAIKDHKIVEAIVVVSPIDKDEIEYKN